MERGYIETTEIRLPAKFVHCTDGSISVNLSWEIVVRARPEFIGLARAIAENIHTWINMTQEMFSELQSQNPETMAKEINLLKAENQILKETVVRLSEANERERKENEKGTPKIAEPSPMNCTTVPKASEFAKPKPGHRICTQCGKEFKKVRNNTRCETCIGKPQTHSGGRKSKSEPSEPKPSEGG